MRQTWFAKQGDVTPKWHCVDAEGKVLGRMATQIAVILMGKHRPEYTPHMDCGDYVIVTNAGKIVLTGRKAEQKLKTRFSGHPGGLKFKTYGELIETRPEFVITDAVRRMLPKGILGRQMLKKLRVFEGPTHPHQAQQPEPIELRGV